jgi:hypothetical protein
MRILKVQPDISTSRPFDLTWRTAHFRKAIFKGNLKITVVRLPLIALKIVLPVLLKGADMIRLVS